MALNQASTSNHSLPMIVLLAVCPILFVLVVIYYLIIYPLQKERRRRSKQAQTDGSSVNIVEAPRRDLHRWIPTLPTPTSTTHRFSPEPLSSRSHQSGYSFQTGSLSASQSAPSTRSLHRGSRPTSELDMLPISNVHVSAAPPPTPPPSAFISPHGVGRVRPLPQPLQDPFSDPNPFSDPDPFFRPGPSYVQGRSAGWEGHAAASEEREHANTSPDPKGVFPPPPSASICSSADRASITTSSTLPPSYRTHRPTHRTASDVPFSGHGRRSDRSQTATSTGEHPYGAGSDPAARSDRQSRYYPRRSMDGGVRLEGGPVDPVTGRGPGKPPRYRQKF